MINENKIQSAPFSVHAIKKKISQAVTLPSISWPYYFVALLLGFVSASDIGVPTVAILGLSSIIFLSLLFKSMNTPFYAIMALIVYIPYSKAISGNLRGMVTGLNFTTALEVIILVGFLARMDRSPVNVLPLEKTFRNIVVLFCLIGAFSIIHTDMVDAAWSFGTALVDYKRWLDPFLVFFVVSYMVRDEEEGRVLIYLMAFSMVIVGIGSIWIKHELENRSNLVRLAGIAGQANTMGAFYANYVFMIVGFLVMKVKGLVRKSYFLLGFMGCLIGLFATESRGDALGFVIGMLMFLFLRNKMLFLSFVIGIVFLAYNIQYLPDGLRQRVQHTVTQQNTDGLTNQSKLDASARERIAIWTGAVRMIESHPFLGVGFNMFQTYIYQYVDHNESTADLPLKRRDGHNAYLMIGAEMGVPALLVFIIILINMFRIAIRSYRASINPFWKIVSACAISSITSLVVTNMFGSRVISLVLAGYIWALVAILLKVPRWAEESNKKGSLKES